MLTQRPSVHVVPRDGRWAVQMSGVRRAKAVKDTQEEAIDVGRALAQRYRTELVVHRLDGTIRSKDSFGNDPPEIPG